MEKCRSIIGIDPGQKGGLACMMDGEVIEYTLMPPTVRGIFDWIDERMVTVASPAIVVELAQSMPGMGVTGCFNYGRHFGTFEAIAAALGLSYHEVRPAAWKKAMGLNAAKANSIKLCQRLFPRVNLVPKGCKVAKDGLAEAILIAEYGRRMNL